MNLAINNQGASEAGRETGHNSARLKEIFDLPIGVCLSDYRKRLHISDPTQQAQLNLNLEQLKKELNDKSCKLLAIDFAALQDLVKQNLLNLSIEEKLILARLHTTLTEIEAVLRSKESEYDQSALTTTFLSLITTVDRCLQWFETTKLEKRIIEAKQTLALQRNSENQILTEIPDTKILDQIEKSVNQIPSWQGLVGNHFNSLNSVNLDLVSSEKTFQGEITGSVTQNDFFMFGTSYASGLKGERKEFAFDFKEITAAATEGEDALYFFDNCIISGEAINISVPIASLDNNQYLPLPTKLGYSLYKLSLPTDIDPGKIKIFRDHLGIVYISGLGKEALGKTIQYTLAPTLIQDIDYNRIEFQRPSSEDGIHKIFPRDSHFMQLLQSADPLSKIELLRDYISYRQGIYHDDPVLVRLLVECPSYLKAMDQIGYLGACSHHEHIQELLFKQNDLPCCGISGFIVEQQPNNSFAFLTSRAHAQIWVPDLQKSQQAVEPTNILAKPKIYSQIEYKEALNRLAVSLQAFKEGNISQEFLESRIADIAKIIKPQQVSQARSIFAYCKALDEFFEELNGAKPDPVRISACFSKVSQFDSVFWYSNNRAALKLNYDFSRAKLAAKVIALSDTKPELGIKKSDYAKFVVASKSDLEDFISQEFREEKEPDLETIFTSQTYAKRLLLEVLKANTEAALKAEQDSLVATNLACYDDAALLKIIEKSKLDNEEKAPLCELGKLFLRLSTVATPESQIISSLPDELYKKINFTLPFNLQTLFDLITLRYGKFQAQTYGSLISLLFKSQRLIIVAKEIIRSNDPKQTLKDFLDSSNFNQVFKKMILNLVTTLNPELLKFAFLAEDMNREFCMFRPPDIDLCDSPAIVIKRILDLKTVFADIATFIDFTTWKLNKSAKADSELLYKLKFPLIQEFIGKMDQIIASKNLQRAFREQNQYGNYLSSKSGFELREYQPGDDVSTVAWNASIRSSSLVSQAFQFKPLVRIEPAMDIQESKMQKNYLCDLNLFSNNFAQNTDLINLFAEIRSRVLANQAVSLVLFIGPMVFLKLSNTELRKIILDRNYSSSETNNIAKTKLEGLLFLLHYFRGVYQAESSEMFDFKKLTAMELANLKAFWAKDLANSEVIIVGEQTTELQKQIQEMSRATRANAHIVLAKGGGSK